MKYLFAFLILFIIGTAQAQYSLGVSCGPVIASVQRSGYGAYHPAMGINAQATSRYNGQFLFFSTSCGLRQTGFLQRVVLTDSSGTILADNAKESNRQSYLSLTQLAGVRFGDSVSGFFAVGFTGGYYLRTVTHFAEYLLENGTTVESYRYVYRNLKNFDLLATAEAGINRRAPNGVTFSLSAVFYYGLVEQHFNFPSTLPGWRNYSLAINFGILRDL